MSLKKKVFFGWIALELACLPLSIPAAAQIMDRVKFAFPARAVSVETFSEPGHKQFIVASNAPFSVISKGSIGEISVDITVNGTVNGNPHGARAQAPGALSACGAAISAAESIIYTSARKTAANRGMVIEQAVKIDVYFDAALTPDLSIVTKDDATQNGILPASSCDNSAA